MDELLPKTFWGCFFFALGLAALVSLGFALTGTALGYLLSLVPLPN